jgi:hypothetical protein
MTIPTSAPSPIRDCFWAELISMLARLSLDFSDEPIGSLHFASCFAPSVGCWAKLYEAIRGAKGFGGVVK